LPRGEPVADTFDTAAAQIAAAQVPPIKPGVLVV
jgi:hypothetical protein